MLANRPDIVREDYMNELCVLQDDVPPFSDDEVRTTSIRFVCWLLRYHPTHHTAHTVPCSSCFLALDVFFPCTSCFLSLLLLALIPRCQAFSIMQESLGRPLEDVFSSISASPVAAASLGQVYKAVLRESGEEVAIKVQRPGVEPVIMRDLFIFRLLGQCINGISRQRLGCNAELIVDEFGEKLLEELDYQQEARNIQEFRNNFTGDATVKIPWVRPDLCGPKLLVMEWIDGIRCTDPDAIRASGISVENFIRVGVVSGLRQLLEFGLFHGDPHPGNIFALRDGRIAYVDFGNVAAISQRNKEVLIDAVVHAVNEDYHEMAQDFIKLVRTTAVMCSSIMLCRAFWHRAPTLHPSCRPWKRSGQTPGGRACQTSTSRASPANSTSWCTSTPSAFQSATHWSSGRSRVRQHECWYQVCPFLPGRC